MTLYQTMKRGGPKKLAPLKDYHCAIRTSGEGPISASLTFGEVEKDEVYKCERIVGQAYELRFNSLDEIKLTLTALEKAHDQWLTQRNFANQTGRRVS